MERLRRLGLLVLHGPDLFAPAEQLVGSVDQLPPHRLTWLVQRLGHQLAPSSFGNRWRSPCSRMTERYLWLGCWVQPHQALHIRIAGQGRPCHQDPDRQVHGCDLDPDCMGTEYAGSSRSGCDEGGGIHQRLCVARLQQSLQRLQIAE